METESENDSESTTLPDESPNLSSWKKGVLNVLFLLSVAVLIAFLGGAAQTGVTLFILLALASVIYVTTLSEDEKQWFEYKIQSMTDEFEEGYQQSLEELEESKENKENTIKVCRECRQEISGNVKRCPHCGWKPKKRGGLWWGTTAVMSLNPIGWAMAAKGAKDNHKASKGVWEETTAPKKSDSSKEEVPSETDPLDKLERLNKLKDSGAIDEEEFEEKKEELLKQV